MQSAIFTLTTDLGLKDHYVPSVKGTLLRMAPSANIIDITHGIEPFNLAAASFVLRGCYADFPEGTLHLACVESDYEKQQQFIAVQAQGQYFLAPDNGLISLVLEEAPVDGAVALPFTPDDLIFPLKNILAPAAARLAAGEPLENLGLPLSDIRRRAHLRPLLEENIIRGTVVHVDYLGNAVTNISSEAMARYAPRPFNIHIRRKEYFDTISRHYNEVPEGEKLALFGSSGYLEISINKGNASGLLGLAPGHTVLVEFM